MTEFRYTELRQQGRTLAGVAIAYGDVARSFFGHEKFIAGAFGDVASIDMILNFQHNRERPLARTGGGGLVLTDSPESLRIEATLPETRENDDVLTLVRRKVLRGFSIEFNTRRETQNGNMREIQSAQLVDIGVVDRPAYPKSEVQARAELRQGGQGLRGTFAYGQDTTTSNVGRIRKERVRAGAFDLDNEGLYDSREIQLVLGSGKQPLASKLGGTLRLTDSLEGLQFDVDRLPDTSYVADLRATLASGSAVLGTRAFYITAPSEIDPSAVIEEPDDSEDAVPGVFRRTVNAAVLTHLVVTYRPPRGNPGAVDQRFAPVAPQVANRRRRLWL